jgi:hypothetical protein
MTPPATLYLFVEGRDDERFLEQQIVPRLSGRPRVRFVRYQNLPRNEIRKYLRAVNAQGASYAFLRDQDDFACHPSVIAHLRSRFRELTPSNVHVVVRSIEAWYLGGVDEAGCRQLGLSWSGLRSGTNQVHKRSLAALREVSCSLTDIELLSGCLDGFDLRRAKRQNESLRRLCGQLGVV